MQLDTSAPASAHLPAISSRSVASRIAGWRRLRAVLLERARRSLRVARAWWTDPVLADAPCAGLVVIEELRTAHELREAARSLTRRIALAEGGAA